MTFSRGNQALRYAQRCVLSQCPHGIIAASKTILMQTAPEYLLFCEMAQRLLAAKAKGFKYIITTQE